MYSRIVAHNNKSLRNLIIMSLFFLWLWYFMDKHKQIPENSNMRMIILIVRLK